MKTYGIYRRNRWTDDFDQWDCKNQFTERLYTCFSEERAQYACKELAEHLMNLYARKGYTVRKDDNFEIIVDRGVNSIRYRYDANYYYYEEDAVLES